MSEVESIKLAADTPLPANVQELQDFVNKQVVGFFNKPENLTELAKHLYSHTHHALTHARQYQQYNQTRNVITRTEYPGSLRATLAAVDKAQVDAGAEPLTVSFQVRDPETNAWSPLEGNPEIIAALAKLVLSESNLVTGEVYYLTQNREVEQLQSQVIDAQLAMNDVQH